MANKPRSEVRRQMELISKFIFGKDNLSDEEIIYQLQIPERTYRRYKSRIEKELTKQWEKQSQDRAGFAHARLSMRLEYCARETKKIIDDPSSRPTDKIEAIKTLDILEAQIATLSREGPTTVRPQLPNKVVKINSTEQEVAI